MWFRRQLNKSEEEQNVPVERGQVMDWTWHVPNDEVVVIAVCYPKTKSEIGQAL